MCIPILSFVGYVYFLARWASIAVGLAPFVVLGGLFVIAYLTSFAHTFIFVHQLVLLVGLAAGIGTLILSCTTQQSSHTAERLRQIHGLVGIVLGGLLFFVWYYHGTLLSYYDEFFWGGFAKSFYHEGGLWTSLSALPRDDMSQAYPPMPAILANLFMPLRGPFTEQSIAMGGVALVLSTGCLAYHYSQERLGQIQAGVLAGIVACTVRVIGAKCEGFYLIGYADYLQGAVFACLLCFAIFEKNPLRKTLLLMLGLPMLALCKQTGIVLCLCVILSALLQQYLHGVRLHRLSVNLTLMLLPTLLSYGTWTAYTKKYIVQPAGSGALLDIRAALADPLLWPSFKAYAWAFVERPLLVSPSLGWLNYGTGTLSFFLVGAGLYVLARCRTHAWDKNASAQILLLLLGAAGWFVLHWYAGFVFFVEPDLYKAACYERYIGPYVSAVWSVFLLMFFMTLAQKPGNTLLINVLLGLNALALIVVCTLPWERPAALSFSAVRQKMTQAAQYLETHTPPHSKIYFVPSGGSTAEEWSLRYLLLPARHGTSLVPQALTVPGQPRPTVKKFLVPPAAEREKLFREQAVDYLFIFSPDADDIHDSSHAPLSYPYLERITKTK
ncbi:MAG: hypothetical protein RRY29_05730 [Desulfovibrionaceae bacterium]